MYHQEGNVHFVASGMGSGKKDNFLVVELNDKGEVQLELKGFNYHKIFELETIKGF